MNFRLLLVACAALVAETAFGADLYLRPSHQNLGVGAAILRKVFGEADAQGLAVRVGALRESDSNRFYARHGFELVSQAEFDNYYVRRPQGAR